jgi:pimeloyl-ACP methyl ester carboxylesterase
MPEIHTPASCAFISQGLRLHYADWGNHLAPPLILVHGSRDHCRSWDWLADKLRHKWHVIALDLRGHGDSGWPHGATGSYSMSAYIGDLAQLIEQKQLAPVTIIGHSLGGNISLRFTGIFPELVRQIIAIEGLGDKWIGEASRPIVERVRSWVEEGRKAAGRRAHRYPTLEAAMGRFSERRPHLSIEQVRHLTEHGMLQNEDGTYSWKFDPQRHNVPTEMTREEVQELWRRIECRVLLVCGTNTHHHDPIADGRVKFFRNVDVVTFEGASHWVHHDRLEELLVHVERFLGRETVGAWS